MRKSREEAAATRVKIIETAARKFRAQGIDGIGLADLMAAAGLTHGGFYRHFDSKDALVAAACGVAATELTAGLEKAAAGQSPAEAMVAACALVGALTMSRIVTDPRMSSQILEHMREHLEHL